MNRRSTNFAHEINEELAKLISSSEFSDKLRYYQILATEYFKLNLTKGLCLYHHMGFGKTLLSYHIMQEMAELNPDNKFIIIAPKALINNFKNSAKKYTEIVGKNIDISKINFVRFSSTTEKQIKEVQDDDPFEFDKKADKLGNIKDLDGYIIFIEEAHMFLRRLSNGSESVIRLYELMMNSKCRIVMLTGSLLASSPFELSPAMNLLSGEIPFPEVEADFEKYFVDTDNEVIKNKHVLQNRIYGLVSRMKPEYLKDVDKSDFPEELPTQIIRVEMDNAQLNHYNLLRIQELKQQKSKNKSTKSVSHQRFKSTAKTSGSYRIRSRQACNSNTSNKIEELYKSKKYTQADLIKAIEEMSVDQLEVGKLKEIAKILKARPKQKGVIYSQFIAVGGAAIIAEYLKRKLGWIELDPELKSVKQSGDKDKNYFARVNGSLTQEDQTKLVDYYSKPDNLYGDNLRLILIGFEQTMGLDLTAVRYEIMYEPYWVDFIREQFKYRAIRFRSHPMLPKEDQNSQMYILLSVFPKGGELNDGENQESETTDEYVYGRMMANKKLLDGYKEAVEEVSIECEIVMKYGAQPHDCKTCIPNDDVLYTKTKGNIPNYAIEYDLRAPDPCIQGEPEEVEAEIITIVTDGVKVKYYKIPDKTNLHGFLLYIKEKDEFIEVPINSPVYKTVKNM